jgi:hypothetical protein
MSNYYGDRNAKSHVDDPRSYRVRLVRFGQTPKGDHAPASLTAFISATSGMQARTNAQGSYPGYTVTDVLEV